MLRLNVLCTILFWAEILLLTRSTLWAAESIISKVSDSSGSYCSLKFPAIREETLYRDRPVLKDPSDGDIISLYGPCNYDPLGKDEVFRQRLEYQRRRRQLPEGE